MNFLDTLENLVNQTAFMSLTVGNYIMIVVAWYAFSKYVS